MWRFCCSSRQSFVNSLIFFLPGAQERVSNQTRALALLRSEFQKANARSVSFTAVFTVDIFAFINLCDTKLKCLLVIVLLILKQRKTFTNANLRPKSYTWCLRKGVRIVLILLKQSPITWVWYLSILYFAQTRKNDVSPDGPKVIQLTTNVTVTNKTKPCVY